MELTKLEIEMYESIIDDYAACFDTHMNEGFVDYDDPTFSKNMAFLDCQLNGLKTKLLKYCRANMNNEFIDYNDPIFNKCDSLIDRKLNKLKTKLLS